MARRKPRAEVKPELYQSAPTPEAARFARDLAALGLAMREAEEVWASHIARHRPAFEAAAREAGRAWAEQAARLAVALRQAGAR